MGGDNPNPIKSLGKGLSTRPFETLGQLADPFGVDPVGHQLHTWVSEVADPPDGMSFAEALATPGAAHGPEDNSVNGQAQANAEQETRNTVQRRRASRTLFTGGQGVTDAPATASTVLLGA